MAYKIQFRRDTTTNWVTKNPVLSPGEVGFDVDLQQFKVGDGVTPWLGLSYYSAAGGVTNVTINNPPIQADSEWILRNLPEPSQVDSDWVLRNVGTGTGTVDSDWVLRNSGTGSVDSDWVLRQIPVDQIDSDWILRRLAIDSDRLSQLFADVDSDRAISLATDIILGVKIDSDYTLFNSKIQAILNRFAPSVVTNSSDINKAPILDANGKLGISTVPYGVVQYVNGAAPDLTGNVNIALGNVVSGNISQRPAVGNNGDIFIINSDSDGTTLGTTYVYDSDSGWNTVQTYQDGSIAAKYVSRGGDQMVGPLYVLKTPTADSEATSKLYVDNLSWTRYTDLLDRINHNRLATDSDIVDVYSAIALNRLDSDWVLRNSGTGSVDSEWVLSQSLSANLTILDGGDATQTGTGSVATASIVDSDWVLLQIPAASQVDSDWVLRNSGTGSVDSEWVLAQIPVDQIDSEWVLAQIPAASQVDSDWVLAQIPVDQIDSEWVLEQIPVDQIDSEWVISQMPIIQADSEWVLASNKISTSTDYVITTPNPLYVALAADEIYLDATDPSYSGVFTKVSTTRKMFLGGDNNWYTTANSVGPVTAWKSNTLVGGKMLVYIQAYNYVSSYNDISSPRGYTAFTMDATDLNYDATSGPASGFGISVVGSNTAFAAHAADLKTLGTSDASGNNSFTLTTAGVGNGTVYNTLVPNNITSTPADGQVIAWDNTNSRYTNITLTTPSVDSDWVLRQIPASSQVDSDWVLRNSGTGSVDSDWVLRQIPVDQIDSDWINTKIQITTSAGYSYIDEWKDSDTSTIGNSFNKSDYKQIIIPAAGKYEITTIFKFNSPTGFDAVIGEWFDDLGNVIANSSTIYDDNTRKIDIIHYEATAARTLTYRIYSVGSNATRDTSAWQKVAVRTINAVVEGGSVDSDWVLRNSGVGSVDSEWVLTQIAPTTPDYIHSRYVHTTGVATNFGQNIAVSTLTTNGAMQVVSSNNLSLGTYGELVLNVGKTYKITAKVRFSGGGASSYADWGIYRSNLVTPARNQMLDVTNRFYADGNATNNSINNKEFYITTDNADDKFSIYVTTSSADLNLFSDTIMELSAEEVAGAINVTNTGSSSNLDSEWVLNNASGSPSRQTVAGTATSLANGSTANVDITGQKSYALLKIQTSAAAWVRLYVSAAARTADASRNELTDPAPGAGVIAEVITTGAETIYISPAAIGFNDESTPTTTIPVAITNKSGSTGDITATLTILKMEQ